MNLVLHPEAYAELAAAVEWYESRDSELGDDLEQDVYDAFDLIIERPLAWQGWPGLDEVRVFPMDRFPFLLPYAIRGGDIVVLAIAHAKRRPGYWRGRIE